MTRSLTRDDGRLVGEPAGAPRFAVAAKGFRLFFLLAGLFAVVILPAWLSMLSGGRGATRYFDAVSWHAHEMVFGFALAVVAGFLLTAVSNWTQRETLVGAPLLALGALWLAGRLVVPAAAVLPTGVAAAIDLSFIPALAVAIGRPLVKAKNTRNLVMLGLLFALFAANACMHAEPLGLLRAGAARKAGLLAVDLLIFLTALMAGRLIPMFTRNATGDESIRSSPSLDALALAALLVLALLDAAAPDGGFAPLWAGIAGVLALLRARFWGMRRAFREPLLWILHLGYAWIPIGLFLRASAVFGGLAGSLATHALTLGALGSLTLGMMARVSLGHTGRPLVAPKAIAVAFAAITGAAIARVFVPLLVPALYFDGVYAAGWLWTLAFALFVWVYTPILLRPRGDGKSG